MSTLSVVTFPRPCTWSHISSLLGYPTFLKMHLGSHFHSLQSDSLQNSVLGTSPQPQDSPTFKTMNLRSQVHGLQDEFASQILHLESHVQSLQGDPTSQKLCLG